MEAIGFVPAYQGIAVHDAWQAYFPYTQSQHALCNAHILRELTYLQEQEQQAWELAYDLLLQEASDGLVMNYTEHQQKHRKSTRRSPARLLLDRLVMHREKILFFLRDARVPFDNNQAERDLRMIRVKEKISGLFRS